MTCITRKNAKDIVFINLSSTLAFLMILFSCKSKTNSHPALQDQEKSHLTEYKWTKIDSFRVERMTRFTMLVYNYKSKKILAYDPITDEYLILNKQGNILQNVKRSGDGPNEYTTRASAASFDHETDGYFVQTTNEFVHYSANWEVKKRTNFSSYHTVVLYSGPRVKTPYYKISDAAPIFFACLFSGVGIFKIVKPEDVDNIKLVEYYSPKTDSIHSALPLYKDLFMPNILEKPNTFIKQVYTIDNKNNLLYLTFQKGKAIGLYDLEKEFQPISKLPISHQEYIKSHGSKNTALFKFDKGLLALLYYKGLSEGEEQLRKDKDPDYNPNSDPRLFSFILFDQGKQIEKELPFPKNASPWPQPLVLQDNCILTMDKANDKVEQEFTDFSIYQLKQTTSNFPQP
ncbi:hypothetical protein [Echinicola shivajiensis]|uniref:hypothetical protein n=1 Tax=Echinicola shivajiensis TaxID=1035916 RepID=UPI001BFCA113|nr:hypothetical protein [Echinicola shivajiensis]